MTIDIEERSHASSTKTGEMLEDDQLDELCDTALATLGELLPKPR